MYLYILINDQDNFDIVKIPQAAEVGVAEAAEAGGERPHTKAKCRVLKPWQKASRAELLFCTLTLTSSSSSWEGR